MNVRDAHCHFFSAGFFRALGRDRAASQGTPASSQPDTDAAVSLPAELQWDAPGTDETLAARWIVELDRRRVAQAVLIASAPGDEQSVARACALHPGRFIGAFMFNPLMPEASARLETALGEQRLRMICLFPAMHHVRLDIDNESVAQVFGAAARHGAAVFVHCGALSIGVRKRLGLPSRFDLRLGDPLAVAAHAVRHPSVPVVIPHFGSGLFREALMAADAAPNIRLDTSSSNNWIRLHPGLTLRDAFARALDVVGPSRLLFGTDSSFFPRGWQQPVFDTQKQILDELNVPVEAQARIFGDNLTQLFPMEAGSSDPAIKR
jgi:predicted TIM-barrel fold metal-dependent hydrolase